MYNIRNVGYEYMIARQCVTDGDLKNAIKHYQSAIDNYEHADNEYILPPNAPYSITTKAGETISYPSVNEMVRKSYKEIRKIKRKLNMTNTI